uniref:Protein kinase domain-containing protein n=1 Tax=Plectus sambesii TaxID=2011161 RepID=A0A914V665_9BILA
MRDYLALSRLPGVLDSPVFATSADGSESILVRVDNKQPYYVLVDHVDGSQTKLTCVDTTHYSELLLEDSEHFGILISDRVIFSLVRKRQNGEYCLIEFLIDDSTKQLTIQTTHQLGVQRHGRTCADLQQYGNYIYVIIWWHEEGNDGRRNERKTTTGFHVLRFERGSTKHVLAANKTVDGKWFAPFVSEGALIFVSCVNMCIISLTEAGRSPEHVSLTSYSETTPSSEVHMSTPRSLNRLAYYYVFDPISNMGQIWTLGQEKAKWRWKETSLRLKSHALSSCTQITITASDIAFLHGRCADATCASQAHIYQLDLTKRPQWDHTEEKLIGSGGYAYVYAIKANYGGGVQDYAMKLLKKELLENADELTQKKLLLLTISEARRVKSLSHPSIARCFGFYFELDRVVTVMELFDGSLRYLKLLKDKNGRQKCLTVSEMISILVQLMEAVFYLHNCPKPIIHRDIKCDNILIDSFGNAKLSDFGLGRELKLTKDLQTRFSCAPREATGTTHWMAPEVHEKQRYGRKTDIWSIGCTCVEMLTGNPPHHYIPESDYRAKLLRNELSFNPQDLIPPDAQTPEVVQLLEKMLFYNINSNFQRGSPHRPSKRMSFKSVKNKIVSKVSSYADSREQRENKSKNKNKNDEQKGVMERANACEILADVRIVKLDADRKKRYKEIDDWYAKELGTIENFRNTGKESEVMLEEEEIFDC